MTEKETLPIVLSTEIIGEGARSYYRVQYGDQVKYIVVQPFCFNTNSLLSPEQFLPRLPNSMEWTVAQFSRDARNVVNISISNPTLLGADCQWHHTSVDCLDLEKTKSISDTVFEAVSPTILPGCTLIAIIARFDWELKPIARETNAYRTLEGTGLTFRFLGHITEDGRVIGFLLEKEEARFADWNDLHDCQMALARLHHLGFLHGRANEQNFVVTKEGVKIRSFACLQEGATPQSKRNEAIQLTSELSRLYLNQPGGPGFIARENIF